MSADTQTYDVLVLGGGTAGTAAAKAAAGEGARVAMFNDGELGGLCILRGCMPTKTMLHAAHTAHEASHSRTPGVRVGGAAIDFPAVMRNKDAKVARFKAAKIEGIEGGGYDVIDARARFVGPDTVEADGRRYRFERGAVIATGSVATVPPIPGLDGVSYLTSDEVMGLTERPDSVVVLGTGAIGLELGQFFARMGTQVSVVSRRPIFCDVGPLISQEMAAAMADEPNLELVQPFGTESVERDGDGVLVRLAGGREIRAQALVVATGRRAAVDDLDLDAAGIQVERGRVVSGPDMQTSNPSVYVAGDASGDRLLLHVANWEGRVAGLNALAGEPVHQVEQRLHMSVVFTDPPMAQVGMNEEEARAAGHDPVVASARYAETGRAITQDVAHGACVLVAERSNGELLGAQLLGPRADDIVHEISAILYYRGTAAQMLEMPWYHPTVSEVFLSLAREIAHEVGS